MLTLDNHEKIKNTIHQETIAPWNFPRCYIIPLKFINDNDLFSIENIIEYTKSSELLMCPEVILRSILAYKTSGLYFLENMKKEDDMDIFISNVIKCFFDINDYVWDKILDILNPTQIKHVIDELKLKDMDELSFRVCWNNIFILFFHKNSFLIDKLEIYFSIIEKSNYENLVFFIKENKKLNELLLSSLEKRECKKILKKRYFNKFSTIKSEYNHLCGLLYNTID